MLQAVVRASRPKLLRRTQPPGADGVDFTYRMVAENGSIHSTYHTTLYLIESKCLTDK